jgi:SAM-dependent methyltransferase
MSRRPDHDVRRPGLLERVRAPLTLSARLRAGIVLRLLGDLRGVRSFMEVGCGQGALASVLAGMYDYRGYEPDEPSFLVARRRLERRGRGLVVNTVPPEEPDRAFDAVGAFEVIEHLEDDGAALAAWSRWLRPGGHLLLSVPAHPERFGAADRYVGHFRRYTRAGLTELAADAGLREVRVISCGFPLGYLLEWGRNAILGAAERRAPEQTDARTSASGRTLQPADAWAPIVWAAALPFQVMQQPFARSDLGTGYVVLAQRAED